jgi:curved DNA-binding protein CbpA
LQQLAQRCLGILGRLLLVERGSFVWTTEELPGAKAVPLGHRWAAYLEPLRKVPMLEVQRRMAAAMNLPVMKSGGLVPLEDLRLTPQEARALTFFDGVRSLAQLVADLPAEAETLLSTAWMLRPLELVSFAATPVSGPAPRPASSPSTPGVPRPVASAPSGVVAPASPPSAVSAADAPTSVPSPSGVGASSPSGVAAFANAPSSAVPGPPPAVGVPRPLGGGVPGPPPGTPGSVPGPPPAATRAPGNPLMPQVGKVSVPYPGQKPSSPKPPAPAPAPPPAPAPAPRPSVVTAAPAAAAPPPTGAGEDEVKQLRALFEQMKKQTYFEVLGLKKDADVSAVKAAYFKLAKSYHPDTVGPGTPEAVAKVKADIFALVGEANRVLSDPKLRSDYLAELDAGGTGEKVDVSAIFQAEELFQKGCILVKARKYADAVKMLDDAIKANAEEGEYYVWRGYAKFFGFSDRKLGQSEAMKDITYGLKKNPNVAAAQYFIGMMAKLNGDLALAKKSFQQCVKMDPQHIDAQRELRMMK